MASATEVTRAPAPWAVHRVDTINIGLLFVSFIAAIVLPFEVFLFSYAVLGPLHYLTEMSWLHDKQYYATGRFDVGLLIAVSLVLTIFFFIQDEPAGADWIRDNIGFATYFRWQAHLIFIALVSAAFFALVKSFEVKLIGVGIAFTLIAVSSRMLNVLAIFVPTLIHVFVFTSLFMLYGALRSNSKPGFVAVGLHLILAIVLLFLLPGVPSIEPTSYGQDAYLEGFAGVNSAILEFDYYQSQLPAEGLSFIDLIFQSDQGIALMRFIAFAYTYHYLNWFSKTEIIRWHAVPRSRFVAVVAVAIASVGLYAIDYSLGLKWLFLLSFMHVLLEFPLNWVSVTGIGKELAKRLQPGAGVPDPTPSGG